MNIEIKTSHGLLHGDLTTPQNPIGLVVFAHGVGSSRLSKRNRFVARKLNEAHFATLLCDLLTQDETLSDECEEQFCFNIVFLANRLSKVIEWIEQESNISGLPIGCFGTNTGAAAAILEASLHPERIQAIVTRGGRPDLVLKALDRVKVPTLLIVGDQDDSMIQIAEKAYPLLTCTKDLKTIHTATHFFEEPVAMDEVVSLTQAWFVAHLKTALPKGERLHDLCHH